MRDKLVLLEKTCPECGRNLVSRDGPYGEFSGCSGFPLCRYTERGADVENIYQTPSPYCEKCNHTGLLPFVKNGKEIPHAFLFCECHESNQPEHYREVRPDDFDFPMSYSYYRSLCRYHGWPEPGSCEIQEDEAEKQPVQEVIHRHSDMSKKEFALLQDTARAVKYLMNKDKEKKGYEPF